MVTTNGITHPHIILYFKKLRAENKIRDSDQIDTATIKRSFQVQIDMFPRKWDPDSLESLKFLLKLG